jgi:hypothetical protein
MKTLLFFLSVIFIFFLSCSSGWSETTQSIDPTSGKLRVTFEEIDLTDNEQMGFMGSSFLYDVNDLFSVGPAAYGALTGERGGFITLGFSGEVRKDLLDYLNLNAGLFVGAGGGRGGYQLSGGGLMLRPHLGLNLKAGTWGNIGVGVSHVSFPDGTISSTQPYVTYEYPFDTLLGKGWLDDNAFYDNAVEQMRSSEHEFTLVYRQYSVPGDVLTDAGTLQHNSIKLLGVEWLQYFSENLFFKIESEGAMGGESTGYMQMFLGGGYRLGLTESTFVKLAAQLGVAGGGAVDTGGGFIMDASLGLQQYLTDDVFVGINGGYVKAPDGSFEATSLALQLGYRYGAPNVGKKSVTLASLADYSRQHIRLRTTHQTYRKDNPNWRSHHSDLSVDNLGLQADYFLSENFYLSGQGLAAYSGKAGAYMIGLVGAGWHQPFLQSPVFVDVEGLVGAAGGGGLNVGGGLVWQANANLGYQISDAFSVIATVGYIDAPEGDFRAKVVGASFAYHFTTFGL